jgi:catechol 2,3-dioxygenase-like lactoylglutathione lyase family enzyme
MDLGAFSVSLSVKDIHASRAFYEKLGFTSMGGTMDENWVILTNGSTVIGLFQWMFEGNILTFNPGWDQAAQAVDPFTDVRQIQQQLRSAGIAFTVEADEASTGPAHIVLTDPDGNTIMVDQHR